MARPQLPASTRSSSFSTVTNHGSRIVIENTIEKVVDSKLSNIGNNRLPVSTSDVSAPNHESKTKISNMLKDLEHFNLSNYGNNFNTSDKPRLPVSTSGSSSSNHEWDTEISNKIVGVKRTTMWDIGNNSNPDSDSMLSSILNPFASFFSSLFEQ